MRHDMGMRLLLAFAASFVPATAGAAPVRVIVESTRAVPELQREARHLTETLLLAIGKLPELAVISEHELEVALEHDREKRDLEACVAEEACLAKLERAVAAEKLMTSQLARWGRGWLLTLALSDMKSASLERGESCQAEALEEIERCATQLAKQLLGRSEEQRDGFRLAAEKTKIAVLDLESYGAEPELARNLTQLMALELAKLDGVEVISRDEVAKVLEYEVEKQVLQCVSDVACLIEIGGALGVEWLVMGGVGKLDETFVIHLKLVRSYDAQVAHRVAESYRGPQRHLAQAIRFAIWRLIGKPVEGTGAVAVDVDADEIELSIDGAAAVPLDRIAPRIAAGKHSLAVASADHHRLSHEFYVEPDGITTLHPELVPLPKDWYEQWWPWAIIGAVVATAVTTSVVVALDDPENGLLGVELERAR